MRRHQCRQRGLTLIELMIAMALGMGVMLAATALLQAAIAGYLAVNDNAQVQESGRQALDLIGRSLRQANYLPRDSAAFMHVRPAMLSPGVSGLDNARFTERSAGMSEPLSNAATHASDALAIRFFGAGAAGRADGGMLNCAGFGVAEPAGAATASLADLDQARGWSIFYVAPDGAGEPELRCKYMTRAGGWSAAAVVRGVESFQVLYGVDDGSRLVYRNAARMAGRWRDVVAVKVALLIRGERNVRDGDAPLVHRLFGPPHADDSDTGATVDEARLAPALQKRLRKVFRTTVWLRNPAS